MAKEMLINVSEGEECRIALLEDGKLEELYMERTSSTSHVGNIYKGRVTNVEPSIQAAFVDFGLGRNGFLHISDLMPTYFGQRGEDIKETVGRKMARRDRPPIQRCLRRGDEIIVQIIKEGIGTKGPTLSTYLSIPGRILVMMPGMSKQGVSRKIEDEEERKRLRTILDGLKPPKDVGFIIRTAGVGKTKADIQRDFNYLMRLWQNIEKKRKSGPGAMELYTEGDLVTRSVRDVFSSEIDRIIVDNKDVAKKVKDFIKIAMPRTKNKVELYEEPLPLFHKYGIEKEIEQMYSRHVPLPSGGSLVIDSTEAIVAIDVNSGKFRDHNDAETTAFKTDMEAADEIPRQLRLRDLGGVIICDFIDLRYERHRRELEKRLHDNLKNDRAKTKVLRMSQFGIIEMTRQRMRPSLKRSIYFDCPHCKGSGLVKTSESMSLDVMRRLAMAINHERVSRVELAVCPEVAFYLQNRKRAQLANLETATKKRIVIRSDANVGLDELRMDLFDARDGLVFLAELGMQPHEGQQPPQQQHRHPQHGGRRDRDDRRHQQGQRPPRHQQPTRHNVEPERAALDEMFETAEDAVDEREDRLAEESAAASDAMVAPLRNGTPSSNAVGDSSDLGEAPGAFNDENGDQQQPRGRRRRRGRRGRRGRGRNRQEQGFDGARQPAAADFNGDADADSGLDEFSRASAEADMPVSDEDPMGSVQAEVELEVDVRPYRQRDDDSDAIFSEPPAQPTMTAAQQQDEAADEVASEPADVAAEEAKPKKRRRGTRGGRGRSRKKKTADSDASAEAESTESAGAASAQAAPEAKSEPAVAAVTVRTGSTDRHLMKDEPVLPEPVRRPRHRRDLDAIPDDFD